MLMLQHFKFKDIFLRKNKNAYISFISKETLNLVLETRPKVNYIAIVSALRRRKIKRRLKELRKLHATTLRSYLPQEIVDLVQGRISKTIFLRFYYKPFLLDIREKTLKAMEPLQHELLEILQ